MNPVADVLRARGLAAARDLAATHPEIPLAPVVGDAALAERVEDALRVDVLRPLVASARAETNAAAARSALRILVPAYLEASASALARACAARRRRALAEWDGDVDGALALEADPAQRRRIASRFEGALDGLRAGEDDLRAARDEAARRLGVADEAELRRLSRDPDAEEGAREVERGFIAPLDDDVAVGVRDRWRVVRGAGPGTPEPCDVPLMSRIPDRTALCPAARLPARLRRLATAAGLDPDALGVRIVATEAPPARTATWILPDSGSVVVIGAASGVRACAEGCAALGGALHAAFLGRTRGAAARALADPAHAHAAEALFRRVASSPAGPAFEARVDEEARHALRLEELIRVRRFWAAARACGAREHDLDARAGGRPLSPGEADALTREARDPWARLAGAMFAALLEERLCTRFGRAWFASPAAGAYLRDLWASGPDAGAAAMAEALGLGRMDSAPLFEAFRLEKGRVA